MTARRAAERTRERVRSNIRASGRVNTGAMLNSIEAREVRNSGGVSTWEVTSRLHYTIFQEKGIGPVVPRVAKVLRFKPAGSSVYIFRPRTSGFKGAHFFRKAREALTLRDFLP